MADNDLLDGLLAEAAGRRPEPSAALMARILQDAEAARPQPRGPVRPRPNWLAALADWFGGGVPLAGMSAAAVAGLYLGVAQPDAIAALAEMVTGNTVESIELLPDTASFWAME